MQATEASSESAIINIAINIFQNVGIRRWIEEIEILKNQQIYFQICKIIFPETIIHLFRLSQNHSLTTGQKIQGVIDLISKLIKNDLYHISGQAIANGKTTHLKNFLQLLEALSNSMITKDRIEVQSAPENDQSFAYNDHNRSYYTVIGIDKEFGAMIYYTDTDEEEAEEDRELPRPIKAVRPKQQEKQMSPREEESSEEFPIIPPRNIPDGSAKKPKSKSKAQQTGNVVDRENTAAVRKTPTFTPAQRSKEEVPYPRPLEEKQEKDFSEENQKWLAMVKGMNEMKTNLEGQRLNQVQKGFENWKANHDCQLLISKRKIQKESSKRKKHINQKINDRQLLLNSLKGEHQAAKAIRKLFMQEQKLKKENRKQMNIRQEENMKKLLNFRELDDLLQKAMKSVRPQKLSMNE